MENTKSKKGIATTTSEQAQEDYGCLCLKPRILQCFNNIRCHVIWQCVFCFIEGFVVNGVINVILPALEKRYKLASKESGMIASSNDFGGFFTYVAVGYIGEHRHKPRIMAGGILLMSVGCLVFALPQFIGDTYSYTVSAGNQSENLCVVDEVAENITSTCPAGETATSYTGYYVMFLIGQILLGIGASPMFTIGISYIDENCKPKLTAFYISWTFCLAAIGVAVGYIVGGQTLSIFVDVDSVDPSSVPLTPQNPQWVGAWWIAVLISMGAFVLVAFPILGYPKRLPGYDELQKERKTEAHAGLSEELTTKGNFGKSWRDFPRAVWILLKNPTYLFICLGGVAEALIIGGMATFGAKLIQVRFNLDLTAAGGIMGLITIPGSGGGMLIGGYLVKKLNLKCRGIIRMCAGFMFSCMLFAPFFLANCPAQDLAGIDTGYMGRSDVHGLDADCNAGCGCSTGGFEPVCVDDENMYFSPCHAGCTAVNVKNDQKIFHGCGCLNYTINTVDTENRARPQNESNSLTGSTSISTNESDFQAVSGDCSDRCPWLYVFCALFLVVMLLTFATMSPAVTATLRCVPHHQRSLAIGVQHLIVRLLGTTPGPILLGTIIDSTCSVWQVTCGTTGSCWIYNRFDMGIRIMGWFIVLKILGVIFFLIAAKVYRAPADETEELHINVKTLPKSSTSNTKKDIQEFTKL